jgi:2-keto-4-pentenoate hydratase/2-oxohepta-3-ene-1,7-dioic acid hydratase in catechol pathway
MRTTRFLDHAGTIRTGDWTDDGIVSHDDVFDPGAIEILPPVDPSKVIGVGPNYYSNIDHYDRVEPDSPSDLLLFVKTVPNSLVAHAGTATLRQSGEFYFEAEIGVVIGDACRDVSPDEAMKYIAGFTCINEITNKGVPESRYDPGNRVRSKSFDNSAVVGPVVASKNLIPADATLELRLNGEQQQRDSRENLIFSIPELLAEITSYVTLEPGDVIATGSPSGVDRLDDGDEVEITVEGIGTLGHAVEIPQN